SNSSLTVAPADISSSTHELPRTSAYAAKRRRVTVMALRLHATGERDPGKASARNRKQKARRARRRADTSQLRITASLLLLLRPRCRLLPLRPPSRATPWRA